MAIRLKERYFGDPELRTWFHRSHADGVLDTKTKHLIHLAVALALKCEPCVVQTFEDLERLGATREEIDETVQCASAVGAGTMLAMASRSADAAEAGYRYWSTRERRA